MNQTRLFARMRRFEADRAFAVLDVEFEDDGLPLAVTEIDEADDIHEISLYADSDDVDATVRRADAAFDRLGLAQRMQAEAIPDIDWVAKSLEGLKPVRAGRFLVHGAHDRDKRQIGDIAIEIEAGLAFGTGHHGTTAGCLKMIEAVARRERPRNALDLGTGSGVLAIALAKYAHIPVLATDIDPIAIKVTDANIRLNGARSYINTQVATGFHHRAFAAHAPYDLIVANILAGPLMKLAPQMAKHLTSNGSVILSGILERQREAVLAAYVAQSFRHRATLHREGWVTLHLKR